MQIIKMFSLILLYVIIFIINVEAISVSQCVVGTGPLPDEVDILNCNSSPCIFYINANTSMTMKFRSPRYMEHFEPNAVAIVLGVTVPYPLGQDDGCDGVTNTPCPLAEKEYIEYTHSMFIAAIFPPIKLSLEISLVDKDRNNEQFECFRVDVQLQNLP